VIFEPIIVPELDAAAGRYIPRNWSPEQIAVLQTYWRRVPISLLEKHCRHSKARLYEKAAELGLPPWGA
jgi:hypothetical protein